jgi:hypothetical protein
MGPGCSLTLGSDVIRSKAELSEPLRLHGADHTRTLHPRYLRPRARPSEVSPIAKAFHRGQPNNMIRLETLARNLMSQVKPIKPVFAPVCGHLSHLCQRTICHICAKAEMSESPILNLFSIFSSLNAVTRIFYGIDFNRYYFVRLFGAVLPSVLTQECFRVRGIQRPDRI